MKLPVMFVYKLEALKHVIRDWLTFSCLLVVRLL